MDQSELFYKEWLYKMNSNLCLYNELVSKAVLNEGKADRDILLDRVNWFFYKKENCMIKNGAKRKYNHKENKTKSETKETSKPTRCTLLIMKKKGCFQAIFLSLKLFALGSREILDAWHVAINKVWLISQVSYHC